MKLALGPDDNVMDPVANYFLICSGNMQNERKELGFHSHNNMPRSQLNTHYVPYLESACPQNTQKYGV